LNNWINAYKGQIDGLRHELAATKYQLDQARYGSPTAAVNDGANAVNDGVNKVDYGSIGLSGVPGRDLLNEVGRRIRRRVGMVLGRSPSP
jgi:hypothetical protein